jgi:hypothetical protein
VSSFFLISVGLHDRLLTPIWRWGRASVRIVRLLRRVAGVRRT